MLELIDWLLRRRSDSPGGIPIYDVFLRKHKYMWACWGLSTESCERGRTAPVGYRYTMIIKYKYMWAFWGLSIDYCEGGRAAPVVATDVGWLHVAEHSFGRNGFKSTSGGQTAQTGSKRPSPGCVWGFLEHPSGTRFIGVGQMAAHPAWYTNIPWFFGNINICEHSGAYRLTTVKVVGQPRWLQTMLVDGMLLSKKYNIYIYIYI